jgi:hypothetical protein
VDSVNCIAKQQHPPFSGVVGFLIIRRIPLADAIVIVTGSGYSGQVRSSSLGNFPLMQTFASYLGILRIFKINSPI